jgi:raffinose/stachyose/melibiose transport system permease protein
MSSISIPKKGFFKRQKNVAYFKASTAMLATLPATLIIFMLALFPALVNIAMSFTNYDGAISRLQFVGFQNYVNFFVIYGNKTIPALLTTFRYMAMMVIPLQIIAFGAAFLVNLKIKGKNFFRALFFLPTILGIAVVSTSWKLMFDPIDGPFARVLEWFGTDSAFLGSENALFFVVIIALWTSFGYSMVIYLAGLAGIDRSLYEAAAIDGASKWQIFTKVTLPLMWPVITICLWIALNGTIHMADYIILTTRGQFGTKTFSYYIYESVIENQVSQGQSAATSIYFTIITTSIMLLFNKFIRSREIY